MIERSVGSHGKTSTINVTYETSVFHFIPSFQIRASGEHRIGTASWSASAVCTGAVTWPAARAPGQLAQDLRAAVLPRCTYIHRKVTKINTVRTYVYFIYMDLNTI